MMWPREKSSTPGLPCKLQISKTNNDILRYSYNLRVVESDEVMSSVKQDEDGTERLKVPRRIVCSPRDANGSPFPTVITVAPAETSEGQTMVAGKQDIAEMKRTSPIRDNRKTAPVDLPRGFISVGLQEKQDFLRKETPFVGFTLDNFADIVDEEHNEELTDFPNDIEDYCNFTPPMEKFRRAARRLGVNLPASELRCRTRRNGICDENDNSAGHRTLLRILNKRF